MLYLLDDTPPDTPFPDPGDAETEPNGLLAVGGDLTPRRLLEAYKAGCFPWFSDDQPILWWSPDPRMVLFPGELQVSRSLRKTLRRGRFQVSTDQAFADVIRGCAGPRRDGDGTWLLPEMIAAYSELHRLGLAHSVEVWQDGKLVGGLYGVSLGKAFFGESMFSRATDASKVALVLLTELCRQAGFAFIDCQVYTEHLHRLGAREIPRPEFLERLEQALQQPGATDWQRPPCTTASLEAAG
jgi:leucyl/phenylalanyl-tRNA--protein transferase